MAEASVPPEASVASTGLDIRYIGKDHCYAFSGTFAAKITDQTLFDFTSGSGYIVATLTLTAPFRMLAGSLVDGRIRGYQLDFNGQTVAMYKVDSQQEDMDAYVEAQILIPPFTAVILSCVDDSAAATYLGTANITGRVYGAE